MNRHNLDELRKLVNAMAGTKTAAQKDSEPYFQPFINNGNGSAVLRFLSAMPGEDLPFVRTFNHAFQVEGKWLIGNCPRTLNQPCPVCEANTALWKSGNKDVVSIRKRKMNYISNVLVVRELQRRRPENRPRAFYLAGERIPTESDFRRASATCRLGARNRPKSSRAALWTNSYRPSDQSSDD